MKMDPTPAPPATPINASGDDPVGSIAGQDLPMTARGRWIAAGLLIVVLDAIVILSMSADVANWWERASRHGQTRLPGPLRRYFNARPYSLDEADVHAVMWFVVATLGLCIVRGWRARVAVAVATICAGGVIELMQAAFTQRSAEWIDVAGDALGVFAAGVLVTAVVGLKRLRAR